MRKFFNWDTAFLFSITLIVLYLTVVPVLVMIFGSLQSGLPGSWTPLTLNNYIEAFSTPSLYQAIFNAIIYSLGAGAISFSLGTYLAWLTERTNITFKGLIYSSVLSALMIPGVLFTISWILLLSPRAGLINVYLRQLFGFTSGPFDPFGMLGMILVSGIDDFYTPFLFMAAAFRSMDPSMEEASITSGAGTMTTFYRVTFRLMLPASLAVGLLIFIRGLEDFEVPALLGIPAGVYVLSTEIFLAVRRPPGDFNMAATFSMFYLLVAMVGLYLYFKSTRFTERFAVITGKAFHPRRLQLGAWRPWLTVSAFAILTIAVYLPLAVLAWTSLLPWYGPPSWEMVQRMTFKNYYWLAEDDLILSSVKNNFTVGFSSAAMVTLFASVYSWIVIRTKVPGRKILDGLAFTATAYPSIVLGLALIWFYLTVPIPIYATLWILIIAYVTKRLPNSIRICSAVLMQIQKELEDASEVCGASFLRTFRRIILPLMVPGLFVSFATTLTITFKALSIPILLGHAGTELLPLLIFDLYESGQYPKLAALGAAIIVIITCVTLAVRFTSQKFGLATSTG